MHCLRHLPDQVRRFGPLFVMSAMGFESAHSFFSHFATGSHGFCHVICRRYIEHHQLLQSHIENDDFAQLTKTWTHQKLAGQIDLRSGDIIDTVQVPNARLLYPEAKIESRCRVGRVLFDSRCYSRSKDAPNSQVCCKKPTGLVFGQVEYFIQFPENDMIYAYTKLYRVIRYGLPDDLELSFGNFLQVEAANSTE